jgi:hypothetical protein
MNMTMHKVGGIRSAASAIALTLALAPLAVQAQSASDWRLPGATVRPAPPGSQGPVDRDNPVVTTSVPRPTQSAAPSPTPSASQPAPTASAAPSPAASRTATPRAVTPAVRQTGAAANPNAVPAAATPTPANSAIPPSAAATDFPTLPTTIPTAPASTPAVVEASSGWYWPWIAGGTALLALIFAGLWWRRRKDNEALPIVFERPVVTPSPAPPVAEPAPVPTLMPEPQLSIEVPGGLGITLEARRMSASLMATTLSYALRLTNTGSEALSGLAVEGDMISAHASLPPEQQIANDGHRLEPRHNLLMLAPGESAEFTGDFRLPLTAVTPIRAGDAAYFVPLARLRVEASNAKGESLVRAQTYVVGELPEAPGAALKPFRLDLGPRTYSKVGQRAVN